MANSLVKFVNQQKHGGQSIHWGRHDLDGAPFRGDAPPMGTEEELDDRLVRVVDVKNRIFDLDVPAENAAYVEIIDKAANNWFTIIAKEMFKIPVIRTMSRVDPESKTTVVDKFRDIKIKVYLEWAEYYMQDGQPMQSQRPYLGRPNT